MNARDVIEAAYLTAPRCPDCACNDHAATSPDCPATATDAPAQSRDGADDDGKVNA